MKEEGKGVDNLQKVSYTDQLMDRVVTEKSDDCIWVWIVEYIAKFKKELWMLHDVFEMAPQLPDDLGEYANEMVAFRCLAYLADPNHGQNNIVSGTEPKVEFDLSDSCEYVLHCVLDEIPLADLKPGSPELSKWNLLDFIRHKRLCLPKCALELLREDSHQEGSGAMRVDGGTDDQVIHGHGGQNVMERMKKEGESIPEGFGNGDRLLGDKDKTSICETNKCDGMIPYGVEENDGGNQDIDATELLEDDNEHTKEAEEGCNLSNENHEGSAEMNRPLEHDDNEFMAAVGLQMMVDANDGNDRTDKSKPNHSQKIDGAATKGDLSSPSTDRHFCKQCKKGGRLLLCSSEECPVMIHEKCLDSPPAYDDLGNFYCPPCAYLLASSEYLQSKAQVAEAKKKLVLFFDLLNSKLKQKIPSDTSGN